MTDDIDVIDVIHSGTPHSAIIPLEPHRLDQIDAGSQTGAKPQDGTNVLGNFRLEKRNSHSRGLAQAVLNVRNGSKGCDPANNGSSALMSHLRPAVAP